jgi:TPR repeat protein
MNINYPLSSNLRDDLSERPRHARNTSMRTLSILVSVILTLGFTAMAGAEQKGEADKYDVLFKAMKEQGYFDIRDALARGDYAAALRQLRPLAEGGDPRAQFDLAEMYESGQGVYTDHEEALRWYRKSALQGDPLAGLRLAGKYAEGDGVPRDSEEAVRWLRPLAERGIPIAQFHLGQMYRDGEGVPRDMSLAMRWIHLAAEQGLAPAQHSLGLIYAEGKGVPQDYGQALKWYREASIQGLAIAQIGLGLLYERGQGVMQDNVHAHKWYNLADAAASDSQFVKAIRDMAKRYRDRVAAQMTPAQILQAQELARQCHASGYRDCGEPQVAPASRNSLQVVAMKIDRGTYVVPVHINGVLTLDFTLDSGASDVTIPEDVVGTLVRAGSIKNEDFIGEQSYVLADGSKVDSRTFRIRSMKVGDRVLENVTGSVVSKQGSLLLGQSFLGRFKSWAVDNTRHVLILE